MAKVDFVMVSKADDFKLDRDFTEKYESEHENVSFNYISDNRDSLGTVYNAFIRMHRTAKDVDFLVLQHSDVSMDIDKLISHLEEVGGKYDVIGLCGASKISVSKTPMNWWCMSNPYPDHKWGSVIHGEMNNERSFFSFHHPDVRDREVACIDGLCIILTRNMIENTDILFDEQFAFNLYDTDISFQTLLNYKKRLGVLIEPSLCHYSVGKGILKDDFLDTEIAFRKKWNFELTDRLREYQKKKKDKAE